MKKHFICVSIYTADKKLCKYEFFFVRNLKTGTKRFNPGQRNSITKSGIIPAKSVQLQC